MNEKLPAAILLLTTTALGQPITAPAGYLNTEGDGSDLNFGSLPTSRYMLMDNLRGPSRAIRECAFRPDYANHTLAVAAGRRWSNITLRMAEGDTWAPTNQFRGKLHTPQTVVFSASMSWPSLQSLPATRPAPFGIRFPFTSPWTYSGRLDMIADFQFTGGSLSSGSTWHPYPLDMAQNLGGSQASYGHGISVAPDRCRDTRRSEPATLRTKQALWNPPNTGPLISFELEIAHAPNSTLLMAVGTGGTMRGLSIPGWRCQRLFVDLSQPTYYLPLQSSGGIASYETPVFPYPPALAGTELWVQAAWIDSVTGRPKLTTGSRQGVFRPQNDRTHHAMIGQGNFGGIFRDGAAIARYR